jgi:hypothetical protein
MWYQDNPEDEPYMIIDGEKWERWELERLCDL